MHPGETEATRAGPAEGMPEVRGRAGVELRMPSRPRLMASPCQLYELCPSLISPESPRPTRQGKDSASAWRDIVLVGTITSGK